MKKTILFICIFILSLPVNASDTQSVWNKESKYDSEACQVAIEEGVEVKLKTSKSLERTAYFFNGSFFMLNDFNENIICFKYSKKDLQIK
ncbi:hypothetical protein OAL90_02975 [Hyphomicrobiales bacterium]|nr:hypothetical protein [Hyphomicrobiales bacterium]